MIYLATPYSHPDAAVRKQRFELACRVAGEMMSAGEYVYSPIAHSHSISEMCDLPTSWDYWRGFDELMIRNCSLVMVVKAEGWQESEGIAAEMIIAAELGKPIGFIEMVEVGKWLEVTQTSRMLTGMNIQSTHERKPS